MTRNPEQAAPIRVLVCGGRDYQDQQAVWDALDALRPVAVLIHGNAAGADRLAANWAESRKVPTQAFTPAWHQHGRRAGPIRNGRMLEIGKPDVVMGVPRRARHSRHGAAGDSGRGRDPAPYSHATTLAAPSRENRPVTQEELTDAVAQLIIAAEALDEQMGHIQLTEYWSKIAPDAQAAYRAMAQLFISAWRGRDRKYKLVPYEPAPNMVMAARDAAAGLRSDKGAQRVWQAMVHAADTVNDAWRSARWPKHSDVPAPTRQPQ